MSNDPDFTVTAKEFQRQPGRFQRMARAHPVTITAHGEPSLVILSVNEFDRLQQRDRLIAALGGLSDEDVEQLLAVAKEATVARNALAHGASADREEIQRSILGLRDKLAELGVAHVSLYGSIARGEGHADSDVDVVVDTKDGAALGLFRLAQVAETLQHVLGRPVDVISRRGLDHTKTLRQRVAADLIDVF